MLRLFRNSSVGVGVGIGVGIGIGIGIGVRIGGVIGVVWWGGICGFNN
jgi:hypothetical protein